MTFLQKGPFLFTTTPKTLFFWVFFWNFRFPVFSCFLFFFLQHKKDKNKKCTFFFENPFFWQPDKLPKKFSHPYTLFVFFKIPKKHYKIGEKQAKKNLGPSFDATLDQLGWVWSCTHLLGTQAELWPQASGMSAELRWPIDHCISGYVLQCLTPLCCISINLFGIACMMHEGLCIHTHTRRASRWEDMCSKHCCHMGSAWFSVPRQQSYHSPQNNYVDNLQRNDYVIVLVSWQHK